MDRSIGCLVGEIGPLTNTYRRRDLEPVDRLLALWRVGDILHMAGIEKPHSVGWAIERATNGIIKRPVVFRAFKIRLVWETEEALLSQCRGLRSVGNVIEMLPYIDPTLRGSDDLPSAELDDLLSRMISSSASEFRLFLKQFKRAHASVRIGERNPRNTHLGDITERYEHLIKLIRELAAVALEATEESRAAVQDCVSLVDVELAAELIDALLDISSPGYRGEGTHHLQRNGHSPMWLTELHELHFSADKRDRARFRRIVGLGDMTKAAGMIRASDNPGKWRRFCEVRFSLGDADDGGQ